jgi:hypothetical protein
MFQVLLLSGTNTNNINMLVVESLEIFNKLYSKMEYMFDIFFALIIINEFDLVTIS